MKAMTMTIALLLAAGVVQGSVTISYDGSVTPDDSSLQAIFSTFVGGGTSWSTSAGKVAMTTAYGTGIWFGNDAAKDPVPWELADNSLGNAISVVARLAPASKEWSISLRDGTYAALARLMQGYIQFYTGPSGSDHYDYTLDTTAYHEYSIVLYDATVVYRVDGDVVYAGSGYFSPSDKYLLIGDTTGTTLTGIGTMYVDRVDIRTEVPEPATLSLLTLGGLAILRRKLR